MSQGDPVPFERAIEAAQKLVSLLQPACERIEIAGSLRRAKPQVRDIELVAIPRWEDRSTGDLWATSPAVDVLEEVISRLLFNGAIEARQVENHRANGTVELQTKLGPAFKALVFDEIPVDLFIVRAPATWGVIFGLRTGPGAWNTQLVTECQAIGRRVEGGQVVMWHGASGSWRAVPTDEERDFFEALGQAWVEPRERHPDRVRISRGVAAGVRPSA